VHRALQLEGLSYERRHGIGPRAFKALNPAAQVPVLLLDDEAVSDSTAIVTRLEAIAPTPLGRSLSASEKGEAFLWEEMADTVLNGFLIAARWLDDENWARTRLAYFETMPRPVRAVVPTLLRRKVRKAMQSREIGRPDLRTTWKRFEQTLDQLEARAPKKGFWISDAPSRADVAIFAQLWSFLTPLTPAQGERVSARPVLAAWLGRVDDACEHAWGATSRILSVAAVPRRMAALG
jgi:glutathione S-transferase